MIGPPVPMGGGEVGFGIFTNRDKQNIVWVCMSVFRGTGHRCFICWVIK